MAVPQQISNPLQLAVSGALDYNYGPYATIAAANTAIPNTDVDGVSFRKGKIVKIGDEINSEEYWWVAPYGDTNLVSLFDTIYNSPLLLTANAKASPGKFIIKDLKGNIMLWLEAGKFYYIGQLSDDIINAISKITNIDESVFRIKDLEGNLILEANKDGVFANIVNSNEIKNFYTRLHISIYGQSPSVLGTGVIAVAAFTSMLTFGGGIITGDPTTGTTGYDPDNPSQVAAYYSTNFVSVTGSGIETPKTAGEVFKRLISLENGASIESAIKIIVNSAGVGGASYDRLTSRTGKDYRRFLESIKYGRDFSIAAGETYDLVATRYIQGEASTDKVKTFEQWKGDLKRFFTYLNYDIKALLGRKDDIIIGAYQTASFLRNGSVGQPYGTVQQPLAALQVAIDMPNVYALAPVYQYQYTLDQFGQKDPLHMTPQSYAIWHAVNGVKEKRFYIDGVKPMPIIPVKNGRKKGWWVQKNTANSKWILTVQMHVPVAPLVWDFSVNTYFETPSSTYGFQILNSSGSNIITGTPRIVFGNTIIFNCSQDPTGLALTYAIDGYVSGGNLRDSQGDTLTTLVDNSANTATIPARLDNWGNTFSQII